MNTRQPIERGTYSIGEVAARLGIGRQLAYRLARDGDLPAMQLGNRIVVSKQRLEELLAAGRTEAKRS